jgi:hypothetical protein
LGDGEKRERDTNGYCYGRKWYKMIKRIKPVHLKNIVFLQRKGGTTFSNIKINQGRSANENGNV